MINYTRGDALDFGKHKGSTVSDVLAKDPEYLNWCLDNVDYFKVDNDIYLDIREEARMAEEARHEEDFDNIPDISECY